MGKKGISPIVAVVVLVGLAVMTGGLVSSWITSFVQDSTRDADTCAITTMFTISDASVNETSGELKVKVKNTGKDDIYNFTLEVDNGTLLKAFKATSPSETYRVSSGETQYIIGNISPHNITSIDTLNVLARSCLGYYPEPVSVKNL
jgi:flagellin-like protein